MVQRAPLIAILKLLDANYVDWLILKRCVFSTCCSVSSRETSGMERLSHHHHMKRVHYLVSFPTHQEFSCTPDIVSQWKLAKLS